MSTWSLTSDTGLVLDEGACLWPDLPADLVVRELRVGDEVFSGFRAYGWQRYTVSDTGGKALSRGFQVIALLPGELVLVTDVDEVYGRRETRLLPASTLTYAPSLLRRGC